MVKRALTALQVVGLPEGEYALTHAVMYLAIAPKSNSVCRALMASRDLARKHGNLEPPKSVINAVTSYDRKELGYGAGYAYAHDFPAHIAKMQFLPDELKDEILVSLEPIGREKDVEARLKYIDEILEKKSRS
jgi:putative ATPase